MNAPRFQGWYVRRKAIMGVPVFYSLDCTFLLVPLGLSIPNAQLNAQLKLRTSGIQVDTVSLQGCRLHFY